MKNSLDKVEAFGGYPVVLADPAWSYSNAGRGAAGNHYKTMSVDEICAMPVSRLAAKDAVLFLWGTWPNLYDALRVIESWGFRYKTLGFLWVKTNTKAGTPFWGGGFWTRSNSEFCLLATRGDIRRVNAGVHQLVETWEDQGDLVLRAPVSKHSAKPAEVRDRILKLMGDLSAIELFARCTDENGNVIPGGRVAEGWDQWGNQCDSDVVLGIDNEFGSQSVSSDTRSDNQTTTIEHVDESLIGAVEKSFITNRKIVDAVSTIELTVSPLQNGQGDLDMANLPKEMLDEVGKARITGGGNYIMHGTYVFMIKKWFFQKSPTGDRCIIVEFLVIESHKKPVYEGSRLVEQEPNAPGTDCSEVANFDGNGKQSAAGNARAVVLGLFGFKENDVPDAKVQETLAYCTDDTVQPAAGMLIACSTFPKEIRSNKGNYITGRNWECVSAPGLGLNTPDAVQARLAALKGGPEEALRVATAQLAQARSTGALAAPAAPTLPAAPAAAPSLPMNGFAPPVNGNGHAPVPPAPPAAMAPPPPVPNPLDGWTVNTNNPDWCWRIGANGQPEQKQKAEILAGR